MIWATVNIFWSVISDFLQKRKYLIGTIVLLFLLDYCGFFARMFEKDFEDFRYPYDGDITNFVARIERGLAPELTPLNYYNFTEIRSPFPRCSQIENLQLVYIVKSSIKHFDKRELIRKTWGNERRFDNVQIITLFVVGKSLDHYTNLVIGDESENFGDIIQLDFIDSYYNNTIKTMSAITWLVKNCPNSRFYFFSDDDMYISTKNVLRFLKNPVNYPDYLEDFPVEFIESSEKKKKISEDKKRFDFELPKKVLFYSGFVFISSPHRHKSSKWYVSLKEYPFNMWPPYVTAGAYVLSSEALFKLYYTSLYTKHFRFDDIYLGILALKAGIEPFHCSYFHFYKKEYDIDSYKYVIASHGYDDFLELESVWLEQKSAGYA